MVSMNDGLTTIIKLEREPIKSRDRTHWTGLGYVNWNCRANGYGQRGGGAAGAVGFFWVY
jgi:hypothetical protein